MSYLFQDNLVGAGTQSFQFDGPDLGFAFESDAVQFQIVAVRDPAAALGIRVGDFLVGINGMPLGDISLSDLTDLLRRSARPLHLRFHQRWRTEQTFEPGGSPLQSSQGAKTRDPQSLEEAILSATDEGLAAYRQHELGRALRVVDQFVKTPNLSLDSDRFPHLLQGMPTNLRRALARVYRLKCFFLEELGLPHEAAMTIQKVQDAFGLEDPDLQWQELKLRPFTLPDGKCWNRTGLEGRWRKNDTAHVPFECCFRPESGRATRDSKTDKTYRDVQAPSVANEPYRNAFPMWSGKRVAILYRGHATRDMKLTFQRFCTGLDGKSTGTQTQITSLTIEKFGIGIDGVSCFHLKTPEPLSTCIRVFTLPTWMANC